MLEWLPVRLSIKHALILFRRCKDVRVTWMGKIKKTLISFVMYGNPFAIVRNVSSRIKTIHRSILTSEVCPVCTKDFEDELPKRMGDETMAKIKQVVEPYLPGLNSAQMHYSRIHTECNGKKPFLPDL
jgi:hypothetical protein